MATVNKLTSGALKGYWVVKPTDKVSNRIYKGKYYTNGSNSFSYGVGQKILKGQYKKNAVIKKQRERKSKVSVIPKVKKVNILTHFPGFRIVKPSDKETDRKFKTTYLTNGQVWFTKTNAEKYTKGEIEYNDLVASSFSGQGVEKESTKKTSKTYRFHDLEELIRFLKHQSSSFEFVFVSINARVKKYQNQDGVRLWMRPLPATFVETSRTEQYAKRLRNFLDTIEIMEYDTMIFDATLFNRGD